MTTQRKQNSFTDLFAVGGEMGALIRDKDWSETPLGAIETWPQSLKSAVSILLPSKAQIALFWGAELTTIYNDAYAEILAEKHPHVLGTPAWVCWSDIWEGRLDGLFQRVLDTGEAFWGEDFIFLMQRRGFLEETYFNISYDPVRDESGGVGGIFAIVSETTRRVLGERRLKTLRDLAEHTSKAKQVEEACRLAAETLGENQADIPFALIYLPDENGQPRLVCTMGVDMLSAVNQEQWRFEEVAAMLPVTNFDGHFPGIWTEPPHTALVLPVLSGGFLVAGVSPRLMLDEDYRSFFELVAGHIGTAISNVRAYEEERKRSEALAALDRAKVEFFSNISHEFRTPLTLMLNPLQELLDDLLTPTQRDSLQMIHRNGLRLLKLVNTLLDFSRIQSNRIQAVYEPTNLATFTADLASSFRSAVEQAGMRLVVDCPPLAQPVSIDREMWEKVVLNLLSNAFKFTFDGEITVSLRGDDRSIYLTVRDTGIGIEADQLPLIFDRFHRVHGVRARTHEGSGIGLALVRELVEFMGGDIQVSSEPQKGTLFVVTVPVNHVEQSASESVSDLKGTDAYVEEALNWLPQTEVYHNGSTAGQHILIADDNADMRDYLRRILEKHYHVHTAKNGREALESVRTHKIDLALVDVMMPEMDGFEFLRQIRANSQAQLLPTILLSARAGEESRVEGLKMGADDYLAKPFSARELLARVEANLHIGQLRREAESRLRTVVENMPVMMFATDGVQRVLMWNRECERVTGYTAEEMIGHPNPGELMYPDLVYREQLRGFYNIHQGTYRNWQVTITCKDGSQREIIWSNISKKFPVAGWDSWLMGIDITERVKFEQQMNSLQEITAALLQAVTPEEVIKVIVQKGITAIGGNAGSVSMMQDEEIHLVAFTGYSEAMMRQWQVIPKDTPIGKAMVEKQPVWIHSRDELERSFPSIDVRLRTSYDGAWAAVPLLVEDQVVGVIGLTFPTSRQFAEVERNFIMTLAQQAGQALERSRAYEAERIARQEAQEANQQKLTFLGMISHELRTPLTSIKGFATTLLADDVSFDEEMQRYFLNIIDLEADKLAVLVDQLLDLARLQAGTLAIFPEARPLSAVIEVATAQLVMLTANHQFSLAIPSDLPPVHADAQRIAQVLVNLVGNAVKFAPVGTKVSVSAVMDGAFVRVDVSDEGPGIELEQRQTIFEAFRQIQSQSQSKNKGAGLGLAICKGIIDSHGGQIWVQSDVSVGTTISFTLPVA